MPAEPKYRPLALNKKKGGFFFTQIKRGKKSVIYSAGNIEGEIDKYEVFLIKKRDAYDFAGGHVPAAEYFPNDNSFGDWAWCYSGDEDGRICAEQRFKEIEEGV